jgi:hypothetical protein
MLLRSFSCALSRLSSEFHYPIFFCERSGSDFVRVSKYLLNTFPACQLLGSDVKKLYVADTTSGMTQEIVWRSTSSQWKNFGVYLLCGLFCWLIVPIFFGVARYLQTKWKIFEVTTSVLKPRLAFLAKSPRRSNCIA